MELRLNALSDPRWQAMGYEMPRYDLAATRARTLSEPRWIHFGAGNLFRAFLAASVDRAIGAGAMDRGLIACATADEIASTYAPYANLCASVVLNADGSVKKQVVGCIAAALDAGSADGLSTLMGAFSRPNLQMASFTITEKGYDASGAREQSDMKGGPTAPASLLGQLCALMIARYEAGAHPIALVSMDNCSHNGEKLASGLLAMARAWQAAGFVSEAFVVYLEDGTAVRYPWTMIDKITPRPDPKVAALLLADGLEGMEIQKTDRGGFTAGFVNAESTGYLVIEDDFPNGRPDLAACGFLMADRATVDKAERMKVCTCLNPLHTALAIFGCLLGYDLISAEMKDADLVALIQRLGYVEGLPVAVDPGILSAREFLDAVLKERFPNPFMPDAPQRIASDTSLKLPIRFGETLKAHLAKGDADSLTALPLVYAGWLRYLTGIDDRGNAFERSPDPMLARVQPVADHLSSRGASFDEQVVEPLLRDASIFGADLYEAGLAARIVTDLRDMLNGPGAVRAKLQNQH